LLRRIFQAYLIVCAVPTFAAITATPSTVSAFPTQNSQTVAVNLTFGATTGPGTGTITFCGTPCPFGISTTPSPVTYAFGTGATSASTSFQFVVPAGVPPGSYPISVTDQSNNAGTTTVTLQVLTPSYTASISPNPATLVIGGASQNVTVTTTPDPGYTLKLTYSFSGFPAFINVPAPQSTAPLAGPYPPLTFNFSLGTGAVGGTYVGTLTGTDPNGQTKTFPFTIIVQQPDIGATFANPAMAVCQGGASVSNSVTLTPLNGYTGKPGATFTSVPAGITITPTNFATTTMPPGQSLPFTVSASAAAPPGTFPAILTITDPAANINKTVTLNITVTAPDYTPSVNPTTVNLTSGGGGQSMTASITPNTCFTSSVTVSASAPAGITFTPPSGPAPATFAVQAASNVAPGTYTATFTFTPASGTTKTVTATINVAAAPDFALSVTPTSVSVQPGQSTTATVSATGVNGFTGTITVTAPSIPGVAFTPSTFTLVPGGSQMVTITASSTATPGTTTATFTGTSPTITGARITRLAVTVLAGPDFTLTTSPSTLTLAPGQSTTLSVSVAALNGFTGSVNVTAPSSPDLTFTPSTFTLNAGSAQMVTVTAAATARQQTFQDVFTGTAAGITHTAPITVTISAAPDFALNVSPSSVTVGRSGTTTVTVSATAINGFTGTINVTSMTSPGLTVSPATFTLNAGSSQSVTLTIATTAPLGAGSVVFSGISGMLGPHTATLGVNVSVQPDFAVIATPPMLSIAAGDRGSVTVQVIGSNGFTGGVTITETAPSGVTVTPATFVLNAGETRTLQIDVASNATGAGTIRFTGNGSPTHTADVLLTILPPRPAITSVSPPAVATATQSVVVRLLGHFFHSGAMVSIANPGVRVESVNVISPEVADVTLSVIAEASAGATTLTLTNPDGGRATAQLLIYPQGSIAAPLGVTNAAIVFPAEGTMIEPSQNIFARGVLATTGTGTIIGSWKFDGVPFDRFTVNVGGGYPAEVRTHLALPISFAGGHTIELQIEAPQFAVAPALHVVMAAASVSRLTLLAPHDGAVIGAPAALFRWSLVPNSTGYVVEIENGPMPKRIRLSESQWRPSAETLKQFDPGVHRWRVRSVFPGETESEPTEWQRFAIVPAHVDLSASASQGHIRWTGGVAGLLYRVEVLDSAGKVIYSALTSATEFTIPPNIKGTARVTAIGPGGITLGSSQTNVGQASVRQPFTLVQQKPVVTNREPANGDKVATTQPHIAATWTGVVKKENIAMFVDETDVTAVATIDASSISYDSLLPLNAGPHTVRLSLAGEINTWSFQVELPPAEAQVQQPSVQRDWAVTPIGTVTVINGDQPGQPDDVRGQISAQSDIASSNSGVKATGDMSVKHGLNDPHETKQESRNWITDFLGGNGKYAGEAKIGYAAPDFTDQSELLATGVARGGVEGRVHLLNSVIASAYETFGTRPAGVVSGNFGPKQTIRALALQTAPNDKWDFRLVGFRVEDEEGPTSGGGTGKAYGLFGKYVFDPKLTTILEVSHGSFEPNVLTPNETRSGNAFRLDFTGIAGTMSYVLNLRRTDAGYVNPANRGFTPGGVPDRTGGNLSITKVIKTTSISLQLRTLRDGNSSGAVLPRNRENGGTLAVATSIGQNTTLALGGNWTGDHGSGNPDAGLPDLDRTQSGANGTVSEAIGRFNLSQNVTVQKLKDKINPISDQTTTAGTLTFGGTPVTDINFAAVLSGTRAAGSREVGDTDTLLLSLQPGFTLQNYGLMIQPRANFNRSTNSLTDIESRSEQYQLLVTWAPARLVNLMSFQVSADASRNSSSVQTTPSKFIHQYVGTLSLKWGAGHGAAMNGTTVVNAPADVAVTNTNNPTTTAAKSQ